MEENRLLHLHSFIWKMLLSEATYKWGTVQATVGQEEAFDNTCLTQGLQVHEVRHKCQIFFVSEEELKEDQKRDI